MNYDIARNDYMLIYACYSSEEALDQKSYNELGFYVLKKVWIEATLLHTSDVHIYTYYYVYNFARMCCIFKHFLIFVHKELHIPHSMILVDL